MGKPSSRQNRTGALTDEELLALHRRSRNTTLTFDERVRLQKIRARVNALRRSLLRSAV